MKKTLLVLVLLGLTACTFLTGEPTKDADGNPTGEYKEAPIVAIGEILGGLLGIGAVGAIGRMVRNTARAKDGLMDANEDAIKNADWKQINTAESFKIMLKTAQESHKDAGLIKDAYDKWKAKKA